MSDFTPYLFIRGELYLVACLLNALLGAADGDVVAVLVRAWNGNLSGRLQLQCRQFLAASSQDVPVMFLGNLHLYTRLEVNIDGEGYWSLF